jgi:hypothetical protein
VEESHTGSQEALIGEVVFKSNCGPMETLATFSQLCLCAVGDVWMGPEQIPWLLDLKSVAAAAQRPAC